MSEESKVPVEVETKTVSESVDKEEAGYDGKMISFEEYSKI